MASSLRYDPACDGLRTFSDVKAALARVHTCEELCALNTAVEERFMRDRRQLAMSDTDWRQYTSLFAEVASKLGL